MNAIWLYDSLPISTVFIYESDHNDLLNNNNSYTYKNVYGFDGKSILMHMHIELAMTVLKIERSSEQDKINGILKIFEVYTNIISLNT